MKKCERFLIRITDITLSVFALLLLTPLFLPVVAILFLTGEHKVFYRQNRVGKNKNIFKLLKFATMLENSPNMGSGTITIKDDPRVLPFGRILRKTKVNELPQLINVLVGDLSLIGPRPLTAEIFEFYAPDTQKIIASVRPGLSGVGSIVFRDEEKILSSVKDTKKFYKDHISVYKGELERWFVKRDHSFSLYIKLIILTVFVVIFPGSTKKLKLISELPMPSDELKLRMGLY